MAQPGSTRASIPASPHGLPGLLALALLLFAGAPPAEAQQVRVEADQTALTALLTRQLGNRWVLWRWRGRDRLVLERPVVEISPRGLNLSGRLRSLTPELDVTVEVRVTPRVKGATLRVDEDGVTVVRPDGMLGYLPRRVLTGWLRSDAGRRELSRFVLDLGPLIRALGDPSGMQVRLRLGFGKVALILTKR